MCLRKLHMRYLTTNIYITSKEPPFYKAGEITLEIREREVSHNSNSFVCN